MSIKIEQTTYEAIEPGVYPGKITDILEEDGQFGPQLKFIFLLDPFEGFEDGKQLHSWCSRKFSSKSKLYTWTTSILGRLPSDYVFDSDDILNKSILVVVDNRFSTDGSQLYDFVESLKPLPKKRNPEQGTQGTLGVSASVPA